MTMKCMKVMLGGLMLAATSFAAQAADDDMSYSNLDLGYVETDIDGIGPSADGFGLRGSVGFAEHYLVFAEYSSQSIANIDIEDMSVGFGGHHEIADNVDLVGKLGWTQVDLSAPGGLEADDDGYLLEVGLRGRLAESVELEGGARYVDLSDSGDDTGFYVGGRYHFNQMWAVGAEYRSGDGASSWLAGMRISF